jgi:arsenate reductase
VSETEVSKTEVSKTKPTVMFVCVHNAGRSQMAAGFLRHYADERIEVLSSGTMPAEQINQIAIEAMAELDIDIASQEPKVLTVEAVKASDVVITMGCGDSCPIFPGKRYLDWSLDDPAGQPIEFVRRVRDDIRQRVLALIDEVAPKH